MKLSCVAKPTNRFAAARRSSPSGFLSSSGGAVCNHSRDLETDKSVLPACRDPVKPQSSLARASNLPAVFQDSYVLPVWQSAVPERRVKLHTCSCESQINP